MNLDCLDCLAWAQKQKRRAKEAQDDEADNGKDNGSVHRQQFYEGQINILDRLERFLQGRLNAKQG